MPELGVLFAGLDMYLGWAAGLLERPKKKWPTYTDTAKLAVQRQRNTHHAKRLLSGQWYVSFPNQTL